MPADVKLCLRRGRFVDYRRVVVEEEQPSVALPYRGEERP